MTAKRYAAIDLGTNTFHILIAEKNETGGFSKVHQQREYVYLGRDGVAHINDKSFKKGVETIELFSRLMKEHQVLDYKMTGTETFRHADNGSEFISTIKKKFDLDITIIDGQTEASYIYKGVQAFLSQPSGKYLIMDIGGGSVEFIYFEGDKMHYSESFPIGISVLHNNFQTADPLTPTDIEKTNNFLNTNLKNLSAYLEGKQIDALVGSAGSFEVISAMLEGSVESAILDKFTSSEFDKMYTSIMPLNKEQRMYYPGIPKERVVFIPIALVLIEFVLKSYKMQDILISPYALKEGIISDFIA